MENLLEMAAMLSRRMAEGDTMRKVSDLVVLSVE